MSPAAEPKNKSLFFAAPESQLLEKPQSKLWTPFGLSSEIKAIDDELTKRASMWDKLEDLPKISYKS